MPEAQVFAACQCNGNPVFVDKFCENCGLPSPLDAPDLVTIGKAARSLRTRIGVVKEFVRKFGPAVQRGRRIRVRLADVRPWFDDREKARRLYEEAMNLPE